MDPSKFTRAEQDKILYEAQKRLTTSWAFPTLEELVVSSEGFGLETATPLQRAICRVIEGQPLGSLNRHPTVINALGGVIDYDLQINSARPKEITILAGIRTAKSLMMAAVAIMVTQTLNIERLGSGEIPRFSIMSLTKDNAKVVLQHLLGALSRPRLQGLRLHDNDLGHWKSVISDAGSDAVGSVFLWNPANRPIEIRVVAGKRAGGSLVSRWSAGVVFDEAPRMLGGGDGVINYDDAKRAVVARMWEGAQLFSIGSPWQPYGPVYDIVQERWGMPTPHHVVIKAPGPDMNPMRFTEEFCEDLKLREPVAYQTDVLAEFADIEESLFTQALLAQCTRSEPRVIPYDAHRDYAAAIDPATRGNAWALVVADRLGNKKREVFHKQWQGSPLKPLSPTKVLLEIKNILEDYNLDWCYTDQWSADAIKEIAADLGLTLAIETWSAEEKTNAFLSLAAQMAEGKIEISYDPVLHTDLKLVRRTPRPGGRGSSIHIPKTSDGRHCDYAPALVHVFKQWIAEDIPEAPDYGTDEYWEAETKRWEDEEIEELEGRSGKSWAEYEPYWDEDVPDIDNDFGWLDPFSME